MKKLSDIFTTLTHTDKDFPMLLDMLNQPTPAEDDFFAVMDIAKYIKDNYMYHGTQLEIKLLNLDKEIFAYLESKVNIKNSKRDWDGMLFYLDKVNYYFTISKDVLIFDGVEDFYLYSMLFPKKRIRLSFGIEHWYFLKRGVAYKHKQDFKNAISNFENAIKCAPMSMSPYEELIGVYFEKGDVDKGKEILDKFYTLCRTPYHLGVFYYYTALYYYQKGNLFVSHICIWYALRFDISLAMRNTLVEKLTDIMSNDNLIVGAFGTLGYESLNANSIPAWYSKEILNASLDMYKACFMSSLAEVKSFKKSLRKKLMQYKLSAYVERIETNAETDKYMFLLEEPSISLKVDKKWQIIYENGETINSVVLELLSEQDTLTVSIFKTSDELNTLYNEEIKKMISSGCEIKNEQQITSINKKTIRSADVYMGPKFRMKLIYLKIGDNFVVLSLVSKDNSTKGNSLLQVANSIKSYNNIEKITKRGKFL